MRLVAIAQQLARREVADPGRPPRQRTARRAAPFVRRGGGLSAEEDQEGAEEDVEDVEDEDEDGDFPEPQLRRQCVLRQRGSGGLQSLLGARLAVLRTCGDAMHTFCKVPCAAQRLLSAKIGVHHIHGDAPVNTDVGWHCWPCRVLLLALITASLH